MDIKSTIDSLTCKSGEANINNVQRIASVSGGAFMLFSALKNFRNPSVSTAFNAIAAGVMLYRGITGHCAVTEAFAKK